MAPFLLSSILISRFEVFQEHFPKSFAGSLFPFEFSASISTHNVLLATFFNVSLFEIYLVGHFPVMVKIDSLKCKAKRSRNLIQKCAYDEIPPSKDLVFYPSCEIFLIS